MRIQSAKAMLTVDLKESGGLGREGFQKVSPLAELASDSGFLPNLTPSNPANVDSEDHGLGPKTAGGVGTIPGREERWQHDE